MSGPAEAHPGPLVTTPLVATETGWLIRRELGTSAETTFYTSIVNGEILIEDLTIRDWARIAELVGSYRDLGLDAADASVIAIAERHHQTTIATLDYRDFRVVRPDHCEAFELIPTPAGRPVT
ncbi:MAG: type II toxin-antitoxin system VapC family toxin [Acidimicrobiales bacterium]